MISFETILKQQSFRFKNKTQFIEYWESCVLETLQIIQSDCFNVNDISSFVDFVLKGMNYKQVTYLFKQSHLLKIVHDVRIFTQNYLNIFELLALYDIEIALEFNEQKRYISIVECTKKIKLVKNMHLYVKLYLIIIQYCKWKNEKIFIKYLRKYLHHIVKYRDVISKKEIFTVIYKSDIFFMLLHKYNKYNIVVEISNLLLKLEVSKKYKSVSSLNLNSITYVDPSNKAL